MTKSKEKQKIQQGTIDRKKHENTQYNTRQMEQFNYTTVQRQRKTHIHKATKKQMNTHQKAPKTLYG